jgi:hypothetical protein
VRISIAVLLAAALPLVPSPSTPPPQPVVRETLRGAWERGFERLAPMREQDRLDSLNQGAFGRINSTRDAARKGERLAPALVDRPLSSW